MSKEAIVERIIADAEAEAQAIIAEAEEKAAASDVAASAQAEKRRAESERETSEKCASISEGKAATARLDSAKVLLGEKRRVINTIYARAYDSLLHLGREECLRLTEQLLAQYASEGDEIVFAANYPYASDAAKLPVVRKKKLSVSAETAQIEGGFLLRGALSDTDLSFGALLAEDREEHQAELAAELFR